MLGSVTKALRGGCFTLPTLNQALKVTAGTASLLSGAIAVKAYRHKTAYNPQTEDGQAWKKIATDELKRTGNISDPTELERLQATKKALEGLPTGQRTGQSRKMLATISGHISRLKELATPNTEADAKKTVAALKEQVENSNVWTVPFTGKKIKETTENQNKAIKYCGLASLAFASALFAPSFVGRVRQVTRL